jgi:Tfp pilus assembly protein PilF
MPDSPRLRQIQQMLAEEPGDPFLHYALAMEQSSLGDNDAAVGTFQELQQSAPDYVPTYLMLAQTLQKLGREPEAAEILRKGISAAEKSGDLHAAGELQGLLAIVE